MEPRKGATLLALAAGFLGCGVGEEELSAEAAVQRSELHAWNGYHWARTSNPFTLLIQDSMTADWDVFLGPVSGDWTQSSVLNTIVSSDSSERRIRKTCKPVQGKLRACNAAYGFNGWLGLAQIWISGTHIFQAVAKVNDSYFSTATYNHPNAKRHVLCQEVGHTFGLGHQTAKSCMDDRNGLFDSAYLSPNAHDFAQLETIYDAHLDSTSTVSGAAIAASAEESSVDEEDLGTPVGAGRRGVELFERHLGGERRLFTWVFWTSPGQP